MSDLVERLRGQTDILDAAGYEVLCREAADEIERLRAKIASLKIQKQEVHEIGWELAKERDSLRAELAGLEAVRREQADGRDYWCAEAKKLRAELATAKRDAIEAKQDVRDLLALKDENTRLRAELAACREDRDALLALVKQAAEWGDDVGEFSIRHCCGTRDFMDHRKGCEFKAAIDEARSK